MSGTGAEVILTQLGQIVLGVVAKKGVESFEDYCARHPWVSAYYLTRKASLQASISRCFDEYREVGYLQNVGPPEHPESGLRTTDAFIASGLVLRVYPDIENFLRIHNCGPDTYKALGLTRTITIHNTPRDSPSSLIERLSFACVQLEVSNPLIESTVKHFEQNNHIKIGARIFENAIAAENDRRLCDGKVEVIPVLAKVLGLCMLCGLHETYTEEFSEILGLSPILESIARAHTAKLCNGNVRNIIPNFVFGGDIVPNKDLRDCVQVGTIDGQGKYVIPCAGHNFPTVSWHITRHGAARKHVYLTRTCADLLRRRHPPTPKHGFLERLVHLTAPSTAIDVHGNVYGYAGNLTHVELFTTGHDADGTLLIGESKIDHIYNQGLIQHVHCGGVAGRACGCRQPDPKKRLFTAGSSGHREHRRTQLPALVGVKLEASSGVFRTMALLDTARIYDFQRHIQRLERHSLGITWRPGDWADGMVIQSSLPISAYLQAPGECLFCAAENAARYGCQEVIACGGVPASAETFIRDSPSHPSPSVSESVVSTGAVPAQLDQTFDATADNIQSLNSESATPSVATTSYTSVGSLPSALTMQKIRRKPLPSR